MLMPSPIGAGRDWGLRRAVAGDLLICGCPGRLPMAWRAPIVPQALLMVWRMKKRSCGGW